MPQPRGTIFLCNERCSQNDGQSKPNQGILHQHILCLVLKWFQIRPLRLKGFAIISVTTYEVCSKMIGLRSSRVKRLGKPLIRWFIR